MTTASSGITPEYQTYFSKVLLKHQIQLLVMDQLGQRKDLPRNKGSKSIRFFRPAAGDRTKVLGPTGYGFLNQLAEGDATQAIASGNQREITWTPIDMTLDIFGEPSRFSDLLDETDLFGTLEDISRLLGEDAAQAADFYITEKIVKGLPATSKRYAQGAAGVHAQTFAGLAGEASLANAVITIKDLLGAMTRLTIVRAPKPKGGKYIAAMPPQVSFDVKLDAKFQDAGTRGTYEGIFTGEAGTWYGIRILEQTQPHIEDSVSNSNEDIYNGVIVPGAGANVGSIFSTICTGSDSFGFPILSGNSPFSPKMIINDKPDSQNPLGQYTTIGWKAYWVAGRLNDDWVIDLRSKVSYV